MTIQLHLEKILFLSFLLDSVSAFTICPWILPVIDLAYHPQGAQTIRLYFNKEVDSEGLDKFLKVPVPDYFDASIEDYESGYECNIAGENSCQNLVEEMAESIDIVRELIRLDSFSLYINVSCLTATSSIAICMGVGGLPNLTMQDYLFHYTDVVAATLCILAGTYSTVVYSMCSIVSFLPFILPFTMIYVVS